MIFKETEMHFGLGGKQCHQDCSLRAHQAKNEPDQGPEPTDHRFFKLRSKSTFFDPQSTGPSNDYSLQHPHAYAYNSGRFTRPDVLPT